MKHIQRARRLGVTIESNIQDRSEDDPENPSSSVCKETKEALSSGMATLCNDPDVEMLVSATNSVSVDCVS